MEQFDIMSVRELIDSAFVDNERGSCPVNFNKIEAVLYILARHLRLLQRQFAVPTRQLNIPRPTSVLAVTEIKVHALGRHSRERGKAVRSKIRAKDYSSMFDLGVSSVDQSASSGQSSSHMGFTKESTKRYKSESLVYRRAKKSSDVKSLTEKRRKSSTFDLHAEKYDDSSAIRHRTVKYLDDVSTPERYTSVKYSTSHADKHRNQPTGKLAGKSKQSKGDEKIYNSDDQEVTRENIYVVTRSPPGRERSNSMILRQSLVTQEQVDSLWVKIRDLQTKYKVVPKELDGAPKPTWMTDNRAALSLSARLDIAEKNLARLMDTITKSAQTKALAAQSKQPKLIYSVAPHASMPNPIEARTSVLSLMSPEATERCITENESPDEKKYVTFDKMLSALKNVRDAATKSTEIVPDPDVMLKKTHVFMLKNDLAVDRVSKKFGDVYNLEKSIYLLGTNIAAIDHQLNSKTSQYQDYLHQLQSDLDISLEKLADLLVSPNVDPVGVSKLSQTFNNYEDDLNFIETKQVALKGDFKKFSNTLNGLLHKIKRLQKMKCTRDEVIDSLDVKISLRDINNLLTYVQMDTNVELWEKLLKKIAHDVYLRQMTWQKAIENVFEKYYACGNIKQLESLSESTWHYCDKLNIAVDDLIAIGSPIKTPNNNKKLKRDSNCLSCGIPANVTFTEEDLEIYREMLAKEGPIDTPAKLSQVIKTEGICIPGQPIPHPLELGSFVCRHDCGVSVHTSNINELIVTPFATSTTTNKKNEVDVHKGGYLCWQCNNTAKESEEFNGFKPI